MIGNHLYIDLEKYIDLQHFDSLHSEICRGIVTASSLAINGSQIINPGSINPSGQGFNVKPLYEVVSLWNNLSEDDPLKVAGKDLNYNQLTTYLKYSLGAYDLYSYYKLLDEDFETNGIGETAKHFPNLINWIFSFQTSGIFDSLHSAILLTLESGGIPWEHCDPEHPEEEKDWVAEFIHIKTDLDRPFYIIDPSTGQRVYMNTRVSWWDEKDWHGGEPINRPTYTLRINGRFSENFKKQIL